MSGGTWNYKAMSIVEEAQRMQRLLTAVAASEHIVDWSEALDTSREHAEKKLYDLWLQTFNEIYGE